MNTWSLYSSLSFKISKRENDINLNTVYPIYFGNSQCAYHNIKTLFYFIDNEFKSVKDAYVIKNDKGHRILKLIYRDVEV